MNRKKVFRLSRLLLNALHQLEHADEKSVQSKAGDILDCFNQFKVAIEESVTVPCKEQQLLLQQSERIIANAESLLQSTALTNIRENIKQILTYLDINAPEMIFLLTAPFDEDARTGDGQYAQTLVQGFSQYSTTSCIWLKQKDRHYSIPSTPGLRPIPANSIPTVFVLQPVANERTVLSGYVCETIDKLDEAIDCINRKITLRTPQVILGPDNKLVCIGFMSGVQKIIFEREAVVERLALVSEQLAELKTNYTGKTVQEVSHIIEQLSQYKKEIYHLLFSTKNKSAEPNTNVPLFVESIGENSLPTTTISASKQLTDKEKAIKLFEQMAQYSQNCGVIVSISKEDFENSAQPLMHLSTILKTWNQEAKKAEKFEKQHHELFESWLLLTSLQEAFDAPRYHESRLVTALEQLSGTRESFYDFIQKRVGLRPIKKPDAAQEFYQTLEIAKVDEDRKNIINQLVETMIRLGEGRKLGVDIHIRTPDTGAFIMPDDIALFQKAGIKVNITVHEYKQNYTRRFLQKMIHDLLRKADSVLFFNEKDKNNAVSAANNGDLDKEHKEQRYWPIDAYKLEEKVGLTVASQVLSGTSLLAPKQVIQKEPNILSFGTIRPGKGFEEALAIAIELKKRADSGLHNFKGIVIISGDPQDTKLMEKLFAERYGSENLKKYQAEPQEPLVDYETMDSKQKQTYWKKAKASLESWVKEMHNPYIEIHPWCELEELERLKKRSKYVCRMDDMGMRNNGSAIISVLDVGVIYTKWGSVTGYEYYPHPVKDHGKGIYGDAVDLGNNKYGLHQNAKEWNKKKKAHSSYKRETMARHPVDDILDSIVKREVDQQQYAYDLTKSANYKTVVAAQKLLKEQFTLQNGVLNLQQAFVLDEQKKPVLELGDEAMPLNSDRYRGILEHSAQANRHLFFSGQQIWESAQRALVHESDVENNDEKVGNIPVVEAELNMA